MGTGEGIFNMSGKSAKHTKGAFGGKRGKIKKAQRLWMANKGLKDQEAKIEKDESSQPS